MQLVCADSSRERVGAIANCSHSVQLSQWKKRASVGFSYISDSTFFVENDSKYMFNVN